MTTVPGSIQEHNSVGAENGYYFSINRQKVHIPKFKVADTLKGINHHHHHHHHLVNL